MLFNPGVSAFAVEGTAGRKIHRNRRQTTGVVFPIINRWGLNINKRIS
jgi:hypothetical protein